VDYASKLTRPVDKLPGAVASLYGINVAVVCVRCGYMSTVVELVSDEIRYVLKVYRTGEVTPSGLADRVVASDTYRATGIPVPEAIRTSDGRAFAEWAGHTLLLMPHMAGTKFEPGDRDQLAGAGVMLGRMHHATRTTDPVSWDEERHRVLDNVGELTTTLRHTDVDVPEKAVSLLNRGVNWASGVRPEPLPSALIHGDFRAQNLLFEGACVSAVLDCDEARVAPRLLDLAYAGVFFQAVVSPVPLGPADWKAFLAAYAGQARLQPQEQRHLPLLLFLAWMKGIALWLGIACLRPANTQVTDWIKAYTGTGIRLYEALP
jgi:homoserine kinase type II